MSIHTISRRALLRGAFGAALSCNPMAAALLSLGATPLARAASGDARALVCIQLAGGNDGFNMLLPAGGKAYETYRAARGSMALDASSCMPLPDGKFQAHGALAPLADLYVNGRVALVANVGTLVQPTSKADYQAGCPLPPALFSHSDQSVIWQGRRADVRGDVGWAGRIGDLLAGYNDTLLPLNISVNGNNPLQSGEMTTPYVMGPTGPLMPNAAQWSGMGPIYEAQLEMAQNASHLFPQHHADVLDKAIDFSGQVMAALEQAPQTSVSYPDTSIASQLRTIADTIAVRGTLGMGRQIFYALQGSYDTHNDQLARHATLLSELSEALRAFQAHLDQLGLSDSVVTFTTSDFGRTLTSNGDGTDHGWGNVHLVLGGPKAVRGGQIFGRYPDLTRNGPEDVGNGRIIPSSSTEQYAATMVRWFGASEAQLDDIFPNLGRFGTRDLGFLNV